MGADLLRQRRNLLITSLGLTAAQLAGATFQGSASIFGAGITFQEPVNLFYGAWVLWGYFLLRYWQYLGEESDLGISKAVSAWLLARFDLYDDDYDDGTRYWIGFRLPDIWVLYAYNEQRDDPDMSSKSSLDVQNSFIKICLFIRAYLVVALMARSNSPTLGHPKFPQAGPPDYDDSGATAMRAAASLRR